jgi:hypothetical protein
MKVGVPALNCLLALAYLATAPTILYLLKLLLHPQPLPSNTKPAKNPVTPSLALVAVSWFKKYTLACVFYHHHRKYLLKEYVITGVFAVSCFHINHIILWPLSLSLLIVPASLLLFDVASKKMRPSTEESSNPEVTNVVDEREI